jgi:SNF2 family DNA or RNA helicase
MQEAIKLITSTSQGTLIKVPVVIERMEDRIFFVKSPFELKNEIKAMQGSRWHGYVDGDNRMMWSVADSTRNNFQLDFMQGGNPYANWDQPLRNWGYSRPLYDHQKLMADCCLTYHYMILAAEMGVGKTLAGIEVLEQSGVLDWWWAGPKSALAAVEREFIKWDLKVMPRLLTYDRLRIEIERWEKGAPAPQGVVFDESTRLKTDSAKRTKAAQHLADCIRAEYGWDGYVILMSGRPSPKSPLNWWAQCEVCYPGFLKEGSAKAFEWRLGIFQKQMTNSGEFFKRVAWRDDARKCNVCGEFADHSSHDIENDDNGLFGESGATHVYVPSKNEVAYLYERLGGLVLPLAKKDCLDIPDKIYREVILPPSSTLKRVAKALAKSAVSVIQGLTWLRELSDGFQYREKQDGDEPCPVCKGEGRCEQWFAVEREDDDGPVDDSVVTNAHDDEADRYELIMSGCSRCVGTGRVPKMVRDTKQIKTPKDQAVRDLLEENEDQGRIVIFAGFQGSIDRIVKICHSQQWNVVKVDGRGWKVQLCSGERTPNKTKPLDYWADMDNERVAFVAHPQSGGMGLTLTEACMAVFYSNDFSPESRWQAEDRIHRPGIDENKGATIVDLFHLGTDVKVLNVLRDNRRLEQMTLTEFQEMTDDD